MCFIKRDFQLSKHVHFAQLKMVVMYTILFYGDLVIEKCFQVFGRQVFNPVHQLMFLLLLLVVVAAIVYAMTKLLL